MLFDPTLQFQTVEFVWGLSVLDPHRLALNQHFSKLVYWSPGTYGILSCNLDCV